MYATKRIPVTAETWKELNRLKEAGQTYDALLRKLVEMEKKARLLEHMGRIEKESKFVPLD